MNITFAFNDLPRPEAKQGYPYRLIWQDGRVAKLVSELYDPITYKVRLNLKENTCVDIAPPQCHFLTTVQPRRMMYIWEKNPKNTMRVGKILERVEEAYKKNKIIKGRLRSKYFINVLFHSKYSQTMAKQLKLKPVSTEKLDDIISCNHLNWLQFSKNDRLHLDLWRTEYEYGIEDFYFDGANSTSFNQFYSVARSLSLTKKNSREVAISSIGAFDIRHKKFPLMNLGFITEFNFNKEAFKNHPHKIKALGRYDKPFCRIIFNVNVTDTLRVLREIEDKEHRAFYNQKKTVDVLFDEYDPDQHFFSQLFRTIERAY